MPKTKIAGYLMILSAIVSIAIDLLNGGGFDMNAHIVDIQSALTGAGFVAVRTAIDKIII